MKHIFIINPVAGKGNVQGVFGSIYNACQKNKLDYRIEITNEVGDATKIAQHYCKHYNNPIIYSVGGDGTLNEVVNGLDLNNATLGVIPTGSGNDFFKMLANSDYDITNRTINGFLDSTNFGTVNGTRFINSTSIGYDAEVAANANIMKENKQNDMVYLRSILKTLSTFKSPNVRVTFDNMTKEQQITLLAICNGRFYGNGICIAPSAMLNDGLLNICLADKLSKAKIAWVLKDLLRCQHEKLDCVHTFQTDSIKIEADELINCNIDGQTFKSKEFNINVSKEKIMILRPKKITK